MKRTKETYFRDFPTEAETNTISGCREFEGEDLSKCFLIKNTTQEDSFSKTNRSSGSTNKSKKKDKEKNNKNMKINSMTTKPLN